mmetsp:Transcript_79967/g.224712  ORF Transcript_79967/g.224712 Transcript_79967/m.224712 type:complete len:91 (+) Transcript_79967:413-685(+)
MLPEKAEQVDRHGAPHSDLGLDPAPVKGERLRLRRQSAADVIAGVVDLLAACRQEPSSPRSECIVEVVLVLQVSIRLRALMLPALVVGTP